MAFHGKVALISGGASGMGRLMALRLASAGAKAAILDRDERALAETVRQHDGIHAYTCDVGNAGLVQSIAQEVEQTLGPIDRVAAAAGIMPAMSIAAMPTDKIAQVMHVNYEGAVNLVKAVLPQMLARKHGDIVLFGSLAGVVYAQNFAAYGASKAALNAFGEVLAEELRGTGLRVLTVRPAAVDTPLINQATGEGGLKGLRKQAQTGRMAKPEQVLDALETALEKGHSVVYPNAEAKLGQFLRRLSPRLTWTIANAAQR